MRLYQWIFAVFDHETALKSFNVTFHLYKTDNEKRTQEEDLV